MTTPSPRRGRSAEPDQRPGRTEAVGPVPTPHEQSSGALDSAIILLVDDDRHVRELLSAALSEEGYVVCAVGTAEEGLAAMKSRRFDLIITDYRLPGRSGAWMLQSAEGEGVLGATPACMITADPWARPMPGIPVLRKPLDLDAFLERIRLIVLPSRRT